jgi:LPS sulfotransferase NodH
MTTGSPPRTREELLDLCEDVFQTPRVAQIRESLAGSRHGDFRTPKNILMMLFPSRSGSNYFGQLLSSTGWFAEIAESFSPGQLHKVMKNKGLNDIHETAQWMVDHRGTPHGFGFKAGVAVLTGAAEVGLLSEVVDRAQIVLLRRRDRVAQAVSLYKGKVSGQMHTRQSSGHPISDEDYDGEAIGREFRNIPRTEGKLAEFARRLGKTAPLYYYEDICADPVTHVTEVCNLMGLEMPWHYAPKKVRLGVLRDGLSERWCERFRSENPDINE